MAAGHARTAADVVVACARVDASDAHVAAAYAGANRETVVEAARHHRLAPLVYVRLRDAVGEELGELAAEQRGQLFGHLRVVAELRRVGETLDGLGVDWVAVKGPVLAAAYDRPDLRTYGDLDLLVDRRRLGDVLDALLASGSSLLDRNWTMIDRDSRGEMSLWLPGGTPLDLHWTLVNDQRLRRAFRFPIDAMLERRTTASVEGVVVPVLDPADALVHLAYHGLHSGGHRLVWMTDIDRTVRAYQPDWRRVLTAADEARARVVTAIALERAARLLGTPVPRDVITALAPALGWRGVVRVADRVRPPELSFRPGATGRLVVEAARGTTPASARAAVTRVATVLASRRRRDDEAGGQKENPLYLDTADDAARLRFLSRLAGDARLV